MGYTHYWVYKDPSPEAMQKVITNVRAIVLDQQAILAGIEGSGKPLMNDEGIFFNGIDAEAHETMCIDREPENGFHFCKTAEKPYDVAVTACLIVLQHFLKDAVEVSSDGEAKDWVAGLNLAESVTGHKFRIPSQVEV